MPRMKYTEALGDKILEGLAEGKSLRAVCREDGMPSAQAVLRWVEEYPEFGDHYTRTRARSYQLLAEEILEISDDSNGDVVVDDNGREQTNAERIARSKLRVDSRKWILAKMLPKVYGDKVSIGGIDGAPAIKTEGSITITAEEAYKKMLNGG